MNRDPVPSQPASDTVGPTPLWRQAWESVTRVAERWWQKARFGGEIIRDYGRVGRVAGLAEGRATAASARLVRGKHGAQLTISVSLGGVVALRVEPLLVSRLRLIVADLEPYARQHCPECGFDLIGSILGGRDQCPECGWAVPEWLRRLVLARGSLPTLQASEGMNAPAIHPPQAQADVASIALGRSPPTSPTPGANPASAADPALPASPACVDHCLRAALLECWRWLPPESRSPAVVEQQARAGLDRAIQEFREDLEAYGITPGQSPPAEPPA